MEPRKYLLLMSLTKTTAAYGVGLLERLRADVDPKANPLWIDASGIGVFMSTPLSAGQVWSRALPEHDRVEHAVSMKDLLILELADDHHGLPESRAIDWLRRHAAAPATA